VAEPKPIHWRWRVRLKPGASSPWFSAKRWKELRWRMSEGNAAAWADKNGCEIEKVEGSGETREDHYGPRGYRGSVSPDRFRLFAGSFLAVAFPRRNPPSLPG
jgi:hypothetical protein